MNNFSNRKILSNLAVLSFIILSSGCSSTPASSLGFLKPPSKFLGALKGLRTASVSEVVDQTDALPNKVSSNRVRLNSPLQNLVLPNSQTASNPSGNSTAPQTSPTPWLNSNPNKQTKDNPYGPIASYAMYQESIMSNNPMDTDRNLPLPSYPDQYGVLQNSRPQEAAPDFVLEDYPSMDTTIDQPFPNQQQQSSVTFSQNIPADQRNQQGQQPMNQQQFSRQQQYSHQQQQQPAHQQPYQYQPAHQKLYQPGYQPAPGPTYVPSHHQAMPGLPGGLPANQTPQMQSLHNEYLIQPVYPSQRETSNLQMHSQSSRQYQHSPQSSAIQGDFLRKQAQTATERAIELVAELKRMRELNEDYQLQIKGLNQTITSKNNEIKKSNELLSAANRQNARFREMVANLRVKVEDLEQEKVAIIKSSDKSLREIESTLDNVLMHSLSKSRERGN